MTADQIGNLRLRRCVYLRHELIELFIGGVKAGDLVVEKVCDPALLVKGHVANSKVREEVVRHTLQTGDALLRGRSLLEEPRGKQRVSDEARINTRT